jgi:hypothetical protein
MPSTDAQIAALPVRGTWQCYVHKLRTWLTGPDGLPVRPYLMLVVSVQDGRFLSCEPEDGTSNPNVTKSEPSPETVLAFLRRVMTHPRQINESESEEKLAPARPETIKFADTVTAGLHRGDKARWADETRCAYVEGCRAGLAAIGVTDVSFAPVPEALVTKIIREGIEPQMAPEEEEYGTQHLPGLMESVDGFTPAFGASLFAAAASYVRAAPWEKLVARRPIQVQYRLVLREDVAMKLTAFASVVGDAESGSYGLSVHKTIESAIEAYRLEKKQAETNGDDAANEEIANSAMAAGGQTCMFQSVYETPFEDADAKEAHGWEIAPGKPDAKEDEENWPLFCKIAFHAGENGEQDTLELTRPAIIELQCFELSFKAIVDLVHSGELKARGDAEEDAAGPWTVKVKSAAGSMEGEEVDVEVEVSLPAIPREGEGGAGGEFL